MAESTVELVVVGSHAPGLFLRVAHPPKAGETVMGWDFQEPVDGGKGSNQAIAAARLGIRTSFVGCVGDDRLGEAAESWLRQAGVDLMHLHKSKTAGTGVGFILLDRDNVPAMVSSLGANAELTRIQVDEALRHFAPAKVLLTQFEIPPEIALHAASQAKQRGMLTMINPAPAPENEIPLKAFQVADYLIPNELEAKSLLGLDSEQRVLPLDLVKSLRNRTGAACVLVTLGEQGAAGADPSGEWQEMSPKVAAVDTSGAGDVFCASFAYGILQGWKNREAASWACKVAALSVTQPGTIPAFPTLSQVDRFIQELA